METTGALRRLLTTAREEPGRTLLVCDDSGYTFSWFVAQAEAMVRRLRCNGFARGDRVALFCDDYDVFFIAMVGVWLAGGVVVPTALVEEFAEAFERHRRHKSGQERLGQ